MPEAVRGARSLRSGRAGRPAQTTPSSTRSARCSIDSRSGSSSPPRASPICRSRRSATACARTCPLPGSGPRNVPDRQRTLAGAIAWSHDLLAPGLQRVLHDLAVFDGGFDYEEAAQVVEPDGGGDVLDDLATLVDQSLIKRDASGSGIRFDMLETIRAFALERLRADGRRRGRPASPRPRLSRACRGCRAEHAWPGSAALARPTDHRLRQHPRPPSAGRIDSGEVELALRFVAGMWRFWQQDGRLYEGTELAESALAMPGADAPTPARLAALSAAGGIAYWQGRREDSFRSLSRGTGAGASARRRRGRGGRDLEPVIRALHRRRLRDSDGHGADRQATVRAGR